MILADQLRKRDLIEPPDSFSGEYIVSGLRDFFYKRMEESQEDLFESYHKVEIPRKTKSEFEALLRTEPELYGVCMFEEKITRVQKLRLISLALSSVIAAVVFSVGLLSFFVQKELLSLFIQKTPSISFFFAIGFPALGIALSSFFALLEGEHYDQ